VPAPPRRFFVETCRALQRDGLADLLLARRADGRCIAGIVVWVGMRERIYAFGASDARFLDLRPNHLLLWTALERAAAAGVTFDLGRAAPEQEGLVEFKRRWGGQPVPLAYDYWPRAAGLNVRARHRGTLALAARVWASLPAPVARLGAALYRYLG
jgi:lipid II:glycine glycyltransferase (peptidoglycan interpeptide bridge formation enzyme)